MIRVEGLLNLAYSVNITEGQTSTYAVVPTEDSSEIICRHHLVKSIHQRRTVELKLQNLNGWEQEDFKEKWDDQPEEKSPTKVFSPPLAPGISVRKVFHRPSKL